MSAAAAMLAPNAAARALAPGVTCEKRTCHNDTDDTYRVDLVMTCTLPGGKVRATVYARPHTTTRVRDYCPTVTKPGELQQQPPTMNPDGTWDNHPPTVGPPRVEFTFPVRVDYRSAVVDNTPPPPAPSGSTGS